MNVRTPTERVYRVCEWLDERDAKGKRANYEKFRGIMRMCHRAVDDGRTVQRGFAYYMALELGWTITEAEDMFKRDNDFWSVLTRYMVMLSPRLARCIDFNTAPIDDVPMQDIWHEIVNPNTVFFAESWKEAKQAVKLGDVTAL